MTSLLAGLGLKHVLPVRQTPKLIFFILGNSTEKKKKSTVADTESSNNANSVQKIGVSDIMLQNTVLDHTKEVLQTDIAPPSGVFNWRLHVRAQLAANLKAGTLKHFAQDFSEVQPNEFAIQLSDDLVSTFV